MDSLSFSKSTTHVNNLRYQIIFERIVFLHTLYQYINH